MAKPRVDFSSMFKLDVELVPTGILSLDIILGGGVSRGDLFEIASPSGVGKSTLLLSVTKSYLKQGKRVAYFDVEKGVKRKILSNFGILDKVSGDVGSDFLLLSPETYDDLELLFEEVVVKDPYDLVVVDSITSVLPAKIKEKKVSEIEIGLKSRQQAVFLEKYKPELRNGGTTVFLVNQMRTKIDISFGGKTELDSAGGNALQFIPDVRLRMEAGPQMKRLEKTVDGEREVVFGNNARIWAVKNRNERSHIKVNIPIIFGLGVSNVMTVIELSKCEGIITSSGAGFFSINIDPENPEKVRGNEALTKWVKTNYPKLLDLLKSRDALQLTKGVVE